MYVFWYILLWERLNKERTHKFFFKKSRDLVEEVKGNERRLFFLTLDGEYLKLAEVIAASKYTDSQLF